MQIEHELNRDRQGIGDRAASEENREGETVVLVDRSTEGHDRLYRHDREGGEPKPKGPTEGKEKPGITFCWRER